MPEPEEVLHLLQELYTAVVLTDRAGQVTWVSKDFTLLCGFELAEVVGRRPEAFLRPDLRDAHTLAYIETSLRQQLPFQYEVSNPRRASAPGWVRVKVQPIRNAPGEVTAMGGLLEDITEWKKSTAHAGRKRKPLPGLGRKCARGALRMAPELRWHVCPRLHKPQAL